MEPVYAERLGHFMSANHITRAGAHGGAGGAFAPPLFEGELV